MVLLALPMALAAGCGGSTTPAPTKAAAPAASLSSGASAGPSATSAATGAAAQKPVPAENTPPGDIPDSVAYLPYTNTAGRYSFTHPEGWSELTRGTTATFTDKLNGVQAVVGSDTVPPTLDTAKQRDVPALTRSQLAFELRSISAVSLPGGTGVLIVYRRNSAPDPVTGRQYRDEVQRYELVHAGREVNVELFGPVGADNADAYRRMIQSMRIA